jgi:hypothetical protein
MTLTGSHWAVLSYCELFENARPELVARWLELSRVAYSFRSMVATARGDRKPGRTTTSLRSQLLAPATPSTTPQYEHARR